ncbi:MAG: hypothetical protein ACI81T_002983, partial [Bacteroidia bacterium]
RQRSKEKRKTEILSSLFFFHFSIPEKWDLSKKTYQS